MATHTREKRTAAQTTSAHDADALTPQEAADLLNEDCAYVEQLLDAGKIPFTAKGRQRHIRRDDVFAYQQERDMIRAQALDELSRLSQEAGLDHIDFAAYRANLS